MTVRLVVNADDFGMSPGVNRGIIEAHERGIVTSASLMVRWPDAPDAARMAADFPDLGLGLHIDLGEWIWQGEERVALYEVVNPRHRQAVEAEVRKQLDQFRDMVGRDPTHLDAHQHVHRRQPVRSIAQSLSAELDVPLRMYHPSITFCPRFYGQVHHGSPAHHRIGVPHLSRVLRSLPDGTHELMCHPGYGEGLATPYRDERIIELRTLTDPAIREIAASLELTSFAPFAAG